MPVLTGGNAPSQVTRDTGLRVELSSVQEDREEAEGPPPRFFLDEAADRDAQHSLEHWLVAGQVSPPPKPSSSLLSLHVLKGP